MPIYNLIEHSDAYLKTSGSLRQYYRDEPTLDANNNIIDFPAKNNNSNSYKFKWKIAGQTVNRGAKTVEIIVPLKYLCNFWRTLEMSLINCKITLQFRRSKKFIPVSDTAVNQVPIF